MRNIQNSKRHLEEIPMDTALDDNVSLALVNRLKARIARRESRFKTRVIEQRAEAQYEPPFMPAA